MLVEQRDKEDNCLLVLVIDESVEKLRQRQSEVGKLRGEVESLSKENKALEGRIKILEAGAAEKK